MSRCRFRDFLLGHQLPLDVSRRHINCISPTMASVSNWSRNWYSCLVPIGAADSRFTPRTCWLACSFQRFSQYGDFRYR
jgi:hypothetical protein